nr:unnamed protein product [Callosobruchus chinensis]
MEYCFTCRTKFCNSKLIKLDKEVVEYLLEVQYNITTSTTSDITTQILSTSTDLSSTDATTESSGSESSENTTIKIPVES